MGRERITALLMGIYYKSWLVKKPGREVIHCMIVLVWIPRLCTVDIEGFEKRIDGVDGGRRR